MRLKKPLITCQASYDVTCAHILDEHKAAKKTVDRLQSVLDNNGLDKKTELCAEGTTHTHSALKQRHIYVMQYRPKDAQT